MPIRPELRPMYRGPRWAEARQRIFERAGGRCEKCRAERGSRYFSPRTGRWVVVQLGVAHLDHDDLKRFHDDDNLLCLCRSCHLRQDLSIHLVHSKATRVARKDRNRPLLEVAA
jgi:hypothetical protein